jgi:phospholipase A1
LYGAAKALLITLKINQNIQEASIMKILKFFITVLILLFTSGLLALESIQPYKPVYFIAGDKENQVKYQVSFKYNLWYPYEGGLALAYTQTARWNLYDKSSPFKEINHNPIVFIERKQPNEYIDFFRIIPYEHISNGLDRIESRSVDKCAVEIQVSCGEFINIGIREKVNCFFALSRYNADYKRYKGLFETELFAQIKSQHGYLGHERLSIQGEWTNKFYWYQAEFSCRIFTTKIRPHIYIQWYDGYAEFLINYNKRTRALRAGFIFNPE